MLYIKSINSEPRLKMVIPWKIFRDISTFCGLYLIKLMNFTSKCISVLTMLSHMTYFLAFLVFAGVCEADRVWTVSSESKLRWDLSFDVAVVQWRNIIS